MNMALWVLQIVLALYYAMGGFYQLNVGKLPPAYFKKVPKPGWIALGAMQIVFALGLVLPGALKIMPQLTPFAALCLIADTMAVYLLIFNKFVLKADIWVLLPGLLAALVAYGRLVLCPF